MYSTILLAACSFGLSFVLTPLLRDLAIRLGCMDEPDHDRKIHQVAVPRIGGIPIVLSYVGAFGVLLVLHAEGSTAVQRVLPLVWRLLPAALLVFATGLLDDVIGLKPWQKLLGQTVGAAVACQAGILIDGLAGYSIPAILGVPLTIIWLVGCSNAFNLIDGVDGVASGVGFLATVTMLIAGLLNGDTGLVMATAPLVGALFAFLRFNFNPASIFLGDSGALWVGFLMGCYGVIWFQKSATILGLTAPLMALSVPLLDTALSIVRRFLSSRPIFRPDRNHIHHRLLNRGLTPRRVALLLYAAGGLGACFSLLLSTVRNGAGGLIVALFCAAVWLGIQYLGYPEFRIAARLLRNGNFQLMVRQQLSLQECEESLRSASTIEECWRAVQFAGREFGFNRVSLRLAGRSFQEEFGNGIGRKWFLHIPLSESEYVQLTQHLGLNGEPAAVAPLAEILHRGLSAKALEFNTAQKPAPSKVISAPSGTYA